MVIPREADYRLLLLLLGGFLPDLYVAGRSISVFRKYEQVCFTICARKYLRACAKNNLHRTSKAGFPHGNAHFPRVRFRPNYYAKKRHDLRYLAVSGSNTPTFRMGIRRAIYTFEGQFAAKADGKGNGSCLTLQMQYRAGIKRRTAWLRACLISVAGMVDLDILEQK